MTEFRYLIAGIALLSGVAVHAASAAYHIVIEEDAQEASLPQVNAFVFDWLRCYECTDGELRRVLRNSKHAKQILEDISTDVSNAINNITIASTVPDPTSALNVRYDAISEYQGIVPAAADRAAYVATRRIAQYGSYLNRAQKALLLINERPVRVDSHEIRKR